LAAAALRGGIFAGWAAAGLGFAGGFGAGFSTGAAAGGCGLIVIGLPMLGFTTNGFGPGLPLAVLPSVRLGPEPGGGSGGLRAGRPEILGRLAGGFSGPLAFLARGGWRRDGRGQRLAPLRKPVLRGRIHRRDDLLDRRPVQVRQAIDAELVQQGGELHARLLRHEPLQTGHLAGVVLLLADDAAQVEPRERAAVERDEVPAECRRGDVMDDEGGDAVQVLERLETVRQRMLAGMLQGKAVGRLEDALQDPPQRERRPRRIGQVLQRLREFRHGRHPHLVEVERPLHEPGEGPLRHVGRSVLQAAGVERLIEQRPVGVGDHRLVGRPQGLVQLGHERTAGWLLRRRFGPRRGGPGGRVGRGGNGLLAGGGLRGRLRGGLGGRLRAGLRSLRCGHASSGSSISRSSAAGSSASA
jgi:hypothetical protein